MKSYVPLLESSPLFLGIKSENIETLLTCLGCHVRFYPKGVYIYLESESIKCAGIVLSGTVQTIKEDLLGGKTILAVMRAGDFFGETFACGATITTTVTYVATADCQILFLPFHKLIHICKLSCVFHHRLIENLVQLLAAKNVQLIEKVDIVSKKTLREKITAYLSLQAEQQKNKYIEIPLGRQELADYLCADRSALTRELSNMQADGLIEFDKNTFRLLF